MMMHKIIPSVYQNELLIQLNDLTNINSLQSPKFLSQRLIKRYHKTLGTSVINSSLSPLSLLLDVLKLLM